VIVTARNEEALSLLLDELTGNAAVSGIPVALERAHAEQPGQVALSAD